MIADTQVLRALVGLFDGNICLSWHTKSTGVLAMNRARSVTPDGVQIAKQHVTGTGTEEFEEQSCFRLLLGLELQVGFHAICGYVVIAP